MSEPNAIEPLSDEEIADVRENLNHDCGDAEHVLPCYLHGRETTHTYMRRLLATIDSLYEKVNRLLSTPSSRDHEDAEVIIRQHEETIADLQARALDDEAVRPLAIKLHDYEGTTCGESDECTWVSDAEKIIREFIAERKAAQS